MQLRAAIGKHDTCVGYRLALSMSHLDRIPFSIQRMSVGDVPQALHLCRESGWNQLHEDWQRLIRYEPAGCFTATCDDQLVGTVTTTRYGSELGWIGMMLVHPDFRRQGIAAALMHRGMDYLKNQQVRCVKLDATPVGKKLYDKLGFRDEWAYHRWSRGGSIATKRTDRPRSHIPLPASAIDLDRIAFGADRCDFLDLLGRVSCVHVDCGGFGMLRPGSRASYLGPITAKTPAAAELIIDELCEKTDRTILWDIPTPNGDATQIANTLGFAPVRDLTRMWIGKECLRPDMRMQYALADPGTG